MKLLDEIFSIKNRDKQKVITILGIKIKFKYNKDENGYLFEKLFCRFVHKFCKVKNNKIVFVNMMNWQFACNPKYIATELLSRNVSNKLDLVWLCTNKTNKDLLPKQFRLVPYSSLSCLYELMTAKIWISNAHMLLVYKKGLIKNNKTIHFQTYHGSMGLKKIDADAIQVYGEKKLNWSKWQKISASTFDYIIVDSEQEKRLLTTSQWGYGKVLTIGKARDKIFYENPAPYIKKIKEYYNIPQENKICLYAPTWRDDKRCYVYNIDINLLKKCLKKRFSGEWSVLIRSHYHMKENIFRALYNPDEVINVKNYPDMQELLVAADILISDYSSCIPEFTILKKPSFIYAADYYYYYYHSNGFYFPLSDLPSPIATDNGELAENILNFDNEKFVKKAEKFLEDKGHKDDGESCKRIVDFIMEKMNEK